MLALAMLLSLVPGMGLTAYADNTETLLTTITATGKEQANYSTANVATVSFSYTAGGSSAYFANWGWWGYGWSATVNAAEGYTITKCVFYDDANRTATDSEAPFVVETTEEDKTPQVNGTPILAYTSKGIKKIEVYGYATPTHTHSFTYSASGATITATCTADGCTLTDSKATLTIAAPDNLTYDKSAKAAVITDANAIQGTAKVQYQTKNSSTYGEATETAPTNAGTYKASITVGGATASVEYTIAKADPTYTVPTGLTTTYGQTLKDVTLPTGWSWADGTKSVGNVGTNTFKANFTPADTANYNTVNNIDVTVTVAKANQTAPAEPTEAGKTINSITLNEIPNGEYKCGAGDWQTSPTFTGLDQNKGYVFRQRYAADANHNASAGSEETVIYTANHEHSFTYSVSGGATITATCNGAGTCNLTDNKVSFTLTVPTSLVYNGTDKKATLEGVAAFNAATGLNVSANDIVYNYKAKSSDSAVVVTETKNAGIYQALYTLQTGFPRPVAGISFTIAKANPTANDFVFSEPDNLNYDGNNKTATVIPQDGVDGMGDATVKYYSDAARTNEVDYAKNAGTYYVGITVNEGDNYNATSAVLYDSSWKFTVAKANPTANDFIFSEPDNLNYDGNNKTATVIPQDGVDGMGDATVKYYSDAARTNEVDYAKNAGTYYVGITVNEGDNYNAASDVLYDSSWKFTVAKANPTCTAPTGLTATYGDTLADVALPDGWAWVDDTTSVGDAGTKTFKANFTPADTTNYNVVENVDVTVKVNPADITPTVTLEGWTYGDEANTPSVTGNAGNGDVAYTYAQKGSDNFSATVPTNAGNYTVKATIAATANYNGTTATADFTIAKADPTYTAPTGVTATYGDTLADIALPTGWTWATNTQSVGGVGTNTFKATFTPTDTTNYNTISDIEVKVTVSKAAGKEAVISTDTMSYTSDSIYIEGVAGQEYVIVPKGTAVTDADWNTSVKPDPERDNWVFFENLKEATEYEIYARTAETETAFASDAVKANVYTTLSSIGYLYDSTLVGASITVEPEPNVEGLTYKWYQDEVTEDGEGIIHHNLTEITGATGSTYTFRAEDAGKHIAVKIFAGDSEVGDFATDAPVASTAKVIFESNGGSDVETLTDAAYQSKIKAPADPTREGFAFDGWYWDEEFETPFDFEKDVITWTETTLYAKWTPNDYKITSVTGLTGANNKQWTKGGKDAVVITVKVSGEDNSFDHFTGVKLDGKELVKDVDYTVEKGSTVVTLKPETLEKLSVGEHTVTVLFDNGEVNTTLTVLAANSQDATSPQTGDNSHMGLWIALMMFSLCGIAATLLYGRKKRVFGK